MLFPFLGDMNKNEQTIGWCSVSDLAWSIPVTAGGRLTMHMRVIGWYNGQVGKAENSFYSEDGGGKSRI